MRTLSFIQVGGGIWGRGWAELVHRTRSFRLAALVDASAEVRAWAAADLGVPVFAHLEQALVRAPAEAVLLVSPPETHRSLAELAIAHGRHVLTEKPLTLALADARALVKLSERTGFHVMVTQNYRFRRQSRALQTLVYSGTLGRLLGVRIVCRRDLRDSWIVPRHWRSEMAHPYLLDMAIHHIDMLRIITGREIAQVDALAWKVPDSPFRMEPNVQALLVLDDGTPIAYEGDFAAAAARPPGTATGRSWASGLAPPGWRRRGAAARPCPTRALRVTSGGRRPAAFASARPGWGPARDPACDHRGHAAGVLGRGQHQQPLSDPPDRRLDRDKEACAGMKIGLFLALFHDRSLDEALDAARIAGCEAVEIATTGPHDAPHLAARAARHGLEISALSCHGNPLHPDEAIAGQADRDFRRTVELAAGGGIWTVITFSGCPGESDHSRRPSWVACSWPDDYPETLDWQWRERVVPYWLEAAEFARQHGVRVAIEPHPGFVVYNTATMLRLRDAAGPGIGVNFDPSHLFWQQIDPAASARGLTGASSTSTQRTQASTKAGWPSTASSRRGPSPATVRGTSARSATVIPLSSGVTSSPRFAMPATTARSRSSTRIHSVRPTTVSRERSERCAAALA